MLAAGRATRFGSPKLLASVAGVKLIDRALAATTGFALIVVVSPDLAAHIALPAGRSLIVNARPEAGMTRSLQLADALAPPGAALAVLPADMPFIDAGVVRRVLAAYGPDVDVVSPMAGSVPAHPVVVGPGPRARLGEVAAGDTLRAVRFDPRWRRTDIALSEPGVALDIDLPEDLE